jgi:hypothetical protein
MLLLFRRFSYQLPCENTTTGIFIGFRFEACNIENETLTCETQVIGAQALETLEL